MKSYGIFSTTFLKALQVGISIDATGLGLCSMGSTLGELFAAPPTRSRLASLVDKHHLFAQHDRTLVDGKDLVR